MILGNKHRRFAKRVNTALLGGAANDRELTFLHKISMQIDQYGQNTRLSDAQMKRLSELLHHLCPTEPETSPSSPLALEDKLEGVRYVAEPEINGQTKTNEAPSSDNPGQPESPPVHKDAFADVPQALMSECFGTAKSCERHGFLLKKYGRKLWIEKLLRGDFELDRPAGKPFVSI